MKRLLSILLASAAIGLAVAPAHATLINRGGGLIYDDDLNITWLQDANYAMTSGYDADGKMTWANAVTWADTLDYGGYSDWRLPTVNPPSDWVLPPADDVNSDLGYDGTTARGWNITTGSEMGHLYYTELGNLGAYDTNGNIQFGWGLTNTEPFINMQPWTYWSGTALEAPAFQMAWGSYFGDGRQMYFTMNADYYALAVRPGDVAAVPEPGTMLLMGTGLAVLIATRRMFRRRHG